MVLLNKEYKCKKCGEMAKFISGVTRGGMRLEQFHCDNCHFTFVTGDGKFIREGVIKDDYIY